MKTEMQKLLEELEVEVKSLKEDVQEARMMKQCEWAITHSISLGGRLRQTEDIIEIIKNKYLNLNILIAEEFQPNKEELLKPNVIISKEQIAAMYAKENAKYLKKGE